MQAGEAERRKSWNDRIRRFAQGYRTRLEVAVRPPLTAPP